MKPENLQPHVADLQLWPERGTTDQNGIGQAWAVVQVSLNSGSKAVYNEQEASIENISKERPTGIANVIVKAYIKFLFNVKVLSR